VRVVHVERTGEVAEQEVSVRRAAEDGDVRGDRELHLPGARQAGAERAARRDAQPVADLPGPYGGLLHRPGPAPVDVDVRPVGADDVDRLEGGVQLDRADALEG